MGGTRLLLRGHYNPTNWSRKYPNLQKTRNAEGKRVLACTNCMRTMSKSSRIAERRSKASAVVAK